MFHARLFNEQGAYRLQHFEPTRAVKKGEGASEPDLEPYLDGNPAIDRPLIVQFCANEPDDILHAAQRVAPYCDAVDLNLGCPQGIARKGHYGAFLQESPDLIYKLINTLHLNLSVPVTAKFRILETKEKTLEYARMILSAGASILTVHGRRREQKGHNTGLADWSYIRYLRDNLPPDTVIFANGNILNHDDFKHCLEATGADAVMSAEGNLSDPTIFAPPPPVGTEVEGYWRGRDGKGGWRLDYVLRRYLDLMYTHVINAPIPDRTRPTQQQQQEEENDGQPPTKKQKKGAKRGRSTSPNLCAMQGHLFQLLRHLITRHTDIRDLLTKCGSGTWANFEKVLAMVEKAVEEGIRSYDKYPEWHETANVPESDTKSVEARATVEMYKRPMWVCQPFIRPLPDEALQIGALQTKKKKDGKNEEGEKKGDGESSSDPVTDAGGKKDGKVVITPDPLVSG